VATPTQPAGTVTVRTAADTNVLSKIRAGACFAP
jgi:hypothetical protein